MTLCIRPLMLVLLACWGVKKTELQSPWTAVRQQRTRCVSRLSSYLWSCRPDSSLVTVTQLLPTWSWGSPGLILSSSIYKRRVIQQWVRDLTPRQFQLWKGKRMSPKEGKLAQERTHVSTWDFTESFWDCSKEEVIYRGGLGVTEPVVFWYHFGVKLADF